MISQYKEVDQLVIEIKNQVNLMLFRAHIKNRPFPFHLLTSFSFSSKLKLHEVKNSSMLIIDDQEQRLPFLSEVQLSNGARGVIMKIQDQGKAYLGLYQSVGLSTSAQIQIKSVDKSWKHSTKKLLDQLSQQQGFGAVYDVNHRIVQKLINKNQESAQNQKIQILNGNKRRLQSSSPILNICYDLYYGDMITFAGCKGSQKSQISQSIVKEFTNNPKNLTIYVNPSIKQTKQFTIQCNIGIAFSIPQGQMPTDVGVYMLALKAIHLSKQLKNKNFNVLLILDNFNDIMLREWNLLQSIKFNAKTADSSKLFQYNSLKVPPISILNEIYSNCEDQRSHVKTNKSSENSQTNSIEKGSMTSILVTQKEKNELVQEISPFSNNFKHLQTLSKVIDFPLNFKINKNVFYQKPKTQEQLQARKSEEGFEHKELHRFLRSYFNKYLQEKQQTELKRQLYKNDIKEAPWDYFFLLDSEWCATGVKEMGSFLHSCKEADQFLRWIVFNIQQDLIGHWNLSAKESYGKFLTYLKNGRNLSEEVSSEKIYFNDEQMEEFVDDARMQGLLNPFKKDYLI